MFDPANDRNMWLAYLEWKSYTEANNVGMGLWKLLEFHSTEYA